MTSAMIPNLSGLAQGANRAAPTGAFEVYKVANYAHLSPEQRDLLGRCPIRETPFYEEQLVWRADALNEGGNNRLYEPEAFLMWAQMQGANPLDPYTKRPIPPAAIQALAERVAALKAARDAADGPDGIYSVWTRGRRNSRGEAAEPSDEAAQLAQQLWRFRTEREGFIKPRGWIPHTSKTVAEDRARAAARTEKARELRQTIDRLPQEGRASPEPPADPAAAAEYWKERDRGVEPLRYW